MQSFEQLNVYRLANLKSSRPQHVHLFVHEELKAELVVLPAHTSLDWHTHADSDELLDVLEGEATFRIEEKVFRGGPGKSTLVHAGTRHQLCNESDTVVILRATYHERLYPRHIGRLIARALRQKLGVAF